MQHEWRTIYTNGHVCYFDWELASVKQQHVVAKTWWPPIWLPRAFCLLKAHHIPASASGAFYWKLKPEIALWFINHICHIFQCYLCTWASREQFVVAVCELPVITPHSVTLMEEFLHRNPGHCSLRLRYILLHLQGNLSCAPKIHHQGRKKNCKKTAVHSSAGYMVYRQAAKGQVKFCKHFVT